MSVTYLNQSDFNSGTYRIKCPGEYVLCEDIWFNPNSPINTPSSGFSFAAISIETSDFCLNLNGKTIKPSDEYVKKNLAGVFAVVLLGNSPFPLDPVGKGFGLPYKTNFFSFPGDTSFKAASNGTIKNGYIDANGSWWGIHGNNNSKINLENLKIQNFSFAGVNLFHVTELKQFKVLITNECNVKIYNTALKNQIHFLKLGLSLLPATIFAGGAGPIMIGKTQAQIIADLDAWVLANSSNYNEVWDFPRTTLSGFNVSSGSPIGTIWENPSFPTTSERCTKRALSSNGGTSTQLDLENLDIFKLKMNAVEVPTIQSSVGLVTRALPPYFLGVFGTARYQDLYLPNGAFQPNALAYAIAAIEYVMYVGYGGFGTPASVKAFYLNDDVVNPGNSGVVLITNSILNPNEGVFAANASREFGRGPYYLSNEGLFGQRIDCSQCIKQKNICSKQLTSIGKASFSAGYVGNDVRSYESSNTSYTDNCELVAGCLTSENGNVFGFQLNNVFRYKTIEFRAKSMKSKNETFGVLVENSEYVLFKNGETEHLYGQTFAPLSSVDSKSVHFVNVLQIQ